MNRSSDVEFITADGKIKEKNYWLKKLSGEPVKTCFPADSPGTSAHSKEPKKISLDIYQFKFPGNIFSRLMKITNDSDPQLFIVLLTSIAALLKKYTGSSDLVLGAPVVRQESEAKFTNTVLVLRTLVENHMTFKDLASAVRQTVVEATENQNYPLNALLYDLEIPFTESDFPLFDIVLLLNKIHDRSYIDHIPVNMLVSFYKSGEGIEGIVEYNVLMYRRRTIEKIFSHFIRLLGVALFKPDIPLGRLDILSGEEKKRLLDDFNRLQAQYPEHKSLYRLFVDQVERTPDYAAVVGAHQLHEANEDGTKGLAPLPGVELLSVTYKELNEKAGQLAHLLSEKVAGFDIIVALMLERSVEMIVCILGILKAGAAYLPINPDHPRGRIQYMLADSGARVLITTSKLKEDGKIGRWEVEQILLRPDCYPGKGEVSPPPSSSNRPQQRSTSLAYVIYTSGSTGKAKGVMMEHRSVLNLVAGLKETIYKNYPPPLKVCLIAPYEFDASVQQIFGALLQGHGLYIVPEESRLDGLQLLEFYRKNQVDISDGTPSHIHLLLQAVEMGGQPSTLPVRHFIIAGEVFPKELAVRFLSAFPTSRFRVSNLYGPTETCVDSTFYHIHPEKIHALDFIPIGFSLPNQQVYILDKDQQLLPIGVPGELFIGGAGVGRGYLNQPKLTNEKFLPGSRGRFLQEESPGRQKHKIYKSGDQARWLDDGNIQFLGRMDQQVKIRGYRIELGEIETTLSQHEDIKEAVVVHYNQEGNPRLVAYVVPRENHPIENTGIRGFLVKHLPDYMVPSAFVILKSLPLTPSGKTDRRKLSALPPDHSLKSENFVAPRTPGEELLAGILADALDVRRIGIHDNFFELGGHSLSAMQVVSRANQAGLSLSLEQFFQHQTIAELSGLVSFPGTSDSGDWLEEEMTIPDGGSFNEIVPISRDGDIPLSFSQQRCRMYQLANPGITYYNIPYWFQIKGKLDINILRKSFNEIIRRHDILRTTFPEKNNSPFQAIMDQQEVDITVTDLQNLPGPEQTRELEKRVKEESERPFDLVHGPLLRVTVLKLEEETHALGLVMHHMIVDFYSMIILSREFSIIYEVFLSGKPCLLPGLTIQYADFAAWQHRYFTRERLEERLRYWEEWLAEKPPRLELPGDRLRPRVETYRGGTKMSQYSPDLVREIKKLAKQSGTSFFMTIMAAFMTSLYHYSGYEDLVVAFPILNRNHQVKTVVGMFTVTLLLRIDMGGNPSFRELLARVHRASILALQKQDVPFEHLVKTLRPGWDLSSKPSYRVLLNTIPYYVEPALEIPGLAITPLTENVVDDRVMRHDLSLNITQEKTPAGTKLGAGWRYKKDLFDAETIDRLAHHFRYLLEEMVKNPEHRVDDLIQDWSVEYKNKETNHESVTDIS